MVPHRRHRIIVALAAIALAGVAACDVPLPRFIVNAPGGAADANPGDGVCETAPGSGICTVIAAFDEANAHPDGAEVLIEDDTFTNADLVVTGNVRLNWGAGRFIAVNSISVLAGAQLLADGVAVSFAGVGVDGVLGLRQSSINGINTQLRIGSTGTVVLQDVTVRSILYDDVVENAGRFHARNSTLVKAGGRPEPVVHTGPGAVTTLDSTLVTWEDFRVGVFPPPRGPACGGAAPTSLGSNAAYDLTCALTGAGDQQGSLPAVTFDLVATGSSPPDGSGLPLLATATPDAGSSLVDAIPVGTNGCGVDRLQDLLRRARPVDGDGDPDTPPACDIGAVERVP